MYLSSSEVFLNKMSLLWIMMQQKYPCAHLGIIAGYYKHEDLESAVDDAVSKAASDIISGRDIWSLNSYRSDIMHNGDVLDNHKFVHPFRVTDKKTGEVLVLPQIIFQELSALDSGCDTVVLGNEDVAKITDMVKGDSDSMVSILEDDEGTLASGRRNILEAHKKYFRISERDHVMMNAADIPFFMNMFPYLTDERLKDHDWLYSINPESVIWEGKEKLFSRNFYWPISYTDSDGLLRTTKIKEGNWDMENSHAFSKISSLLNLMYTNRKGGQATWAVLKLLGKGLPQHPLDGLSILPSAIGLLAKKQPIPEDLGDKVVHMLTNDAFSQFSKKKKVNSKIVMNSDPFALKDYDAINEDFAYFNAVLQKAVDIYGMEDGLAKMSPFPKRLRELGHRFADQDDILLVKDFPEIIAWYLSAVNDKFMEFPYSLGEKNRTRFDGISEEELEKVRNTQLKPLFDESGVFIGYPKGVDVYKTIRYLSEDYIPRYHKDKEHFSRA